jgi:exosome complex RNA-binding protein Csl4
MTTIQKMSDINQTIMFGNLTNDQLNSVITAVKFARNQLLKETKRSISVGSDVKFVNSRNGQTVMGKVTSIKTKNVIVAVGLSNWRVPANMLEVI